MFFVPQYHNVSAHNGYDTDVAAWIAAVIAAGGTVSAQQAAYVNTLVIGLKAASIWTLLDRLWLFAAENATQALTDLVARAAATAVNSPTFTANRGFLGNGTSAYVDLGVAASALTKFTQNSAHLGVYVRDGDGTTNLIVGSANSGSGATSYVTSGVGTLSDFRINTAGTANSMTQGAQNGMHIADRQSSTVGSWSHNGVDTTVDQTVTTSSIRADSNLTTLARNTSGVFSNFSGSRVAALSVGGTLGAAGRAALASLINAYMTSIGANTY